MNDLGAVPPDTDKVIVPLAPLKHNGFVLDVESDNAAGCVIVTLAVAVHELSSVTVTL
jgi:hypothetical protein